MQNDNPTNEEAVKNSAKKLGLGFVSLASLKIPYETLMMIPKNVAEQYKIISYNYIEKPNKILKIAVANPDMLKQKAPPIIVDFNKNKNIKISLALTAMEDFNAALKLYDQQQEINQPEIKKPETGKTDNIPNLRPLPDLLEKPLDTKAPAIKLQSENNQTNVQNAISKINLAGKQIPFAVISKFPRDVASQYQMIVFNVSADNKTIDVGAVEPNKTEVKKILDLVKEKNKININLYQLSKTDFDYGFNFYNNQNINQAKFPQNSEKKPIADVKAEKSIKHDELTPLEEAVLEEKPEPIQKIEKYDAAHNIGKLESHTEIPKRPALTSDEEENDLDAMLPNGIKTQETLAEIVQGGMIPKIVAGLIYFAVEQDSSDIHLEPTSQDLRLRYRVDGILHEIMRLPLDLHPPIISRIKIISKMKIDETRLPQDGRFGVYCAKKELDVRVSSLDTVHGEKIVMRLLDKTSGLRDIKELGLDKTNFTRIIENIKKPYGIILNTGPTGSGKTTTLYALLTELNKTKVNIVTFEDPVEYEIPGINQCQVKPKIGFNFVDGLRSVLRQDPNIIMVGEIRDSETANMAVQAALTGHLVLSTLHTNNAAGAIPRLINMGVEPFLITSSVNCVVAQRLVRRLCSKCKERVQISTPLQNEIKNILQVSKSQEVSKYKDKELVFYKAKGCPFCNGGYKGRVGLFEVLTISDKIEDLSIHKQSADTIEDQAISEGMITLRQDGITKALQGLTTLDEVMKETQK